MSIVVQPPPPLVPVAPHSGASSQRKSTPRNKLRYSGGAGGASQQPRRATPRASPRVNDSSNASGVEASPAPSSATTGRVNQVAKAKKPWFKRRTPKPTPSSEVQGRNTGTSVTAGSGGDSIQQKPVESLSPAPKVQQPRLVPRAQAKDGSGQPGQTEETKTAQPKRDKLSGEKKKEREAKKNEKKEAHFNLVLSAARATITALNKYNLPCAVFGSLACKLYGSARFPKDVDLLVLQPPSSDPSIPTHTAEQIKVLIIDADPRHFFLKLPRNPEATYRILYYRKEYLGAECKVDILIPGVMNLPYIPPPSSLLEPSAGGNLNGQDTNNPGKFNPAATVDVADSPSSSITLAPHAPPSSHRDYIKIVHGIPLVPFSLLLLHKLQGWDDHRIAPEEFKQRKQGQDAADIRRLLAMEEKMQELRSTRPWSDPDLFSEEFQQLTRTRVKEYCKVFPTRVNPWHLLGFETTQDAADGERQLEDPVNNV